MKQGNVKLKMLSAAEICAMDIPDHPFLVQEYLSETSLNFLGGETGCGKSLLVMNLAIAVATGKEEWMGLKIARHGKTIYLNNELSLSQCRDRLLAMDGDTSEILIPEVFPKLKECWGSLVSVCKREKPRLVIIDALYFAHDFDENDSSAMRRLMDPLVRMKNQLCLAILVVHHTRKNTTGLKAHTDLLRGSGVLSDVSDTVLYMRRKSLGDKTICSLEPTKFRHVSAKHRGRLLLTLDDETLWFHAERHEESGDETQGASSVGQRIDWVEVFSGSDELTTGQIVAACGSIDKSDRTIRRAIEAAVANGALRKVRFGVYAVNK